MQPDFGLWSLRELDTGTCSTTFQRGDNLCDFLFVLLHTKPFLGRDLLCKEGICSLSLRKWIYVVGKHLSLSLYRADPFEKGTKHFDRVTSPLNKYVYSPSLQHYTACAIMNASMKMSS